MTTFHGKHAMLCVLSVFLGGASISTNASDVKVYYQEDYNKDHEDVKAIFATQAMGTLVKATVFAKDRKTIERMARQFSRTLTRHENFTTVHKPSPMTTLNSKSGEWVCIPCEAAHILQKAKDVATYTNGAFDPTIGSITAEWAIGFGGRSLPQEASIQDARKLVDWRKISVDFKDEGKGLCQARIGKGQIVDLGGIVKGWSNEVLANQVKKDGAHRAMVVLGGNTAFVGKPTYSNNWLTPIPMPDNNRLYGGYFRLSEGDIVSTSGDMERHIDIDGQRYGHIMNGKTGKPAQNKFAYVTVIDSDGARGDALSTALWVMGDKAFDFLKAHPEIQALLVMKEVRVAYITPNLANRTYVKSERLTLNNIE